MDCRATSTSAVVRCLFVLSLVRLTYLVLGANSIIRQFQSPFSSSTMNIPEQTNISRANSRASARSRNGSSMSRNQSLIKKNISHLDLKPADVLIERFIAWRAIVQQLTAYFEVCFHPQSFGLLAYTLKGIADIEKNTAKELSKLANVIQLPFKAGNQFLGEGGLQVTSVIRLQKSIELIIHRRMSFTT